MLESVGHLIKHVFIPGRFVLRSRIQRIKKPSKLLKPLNILPKLINEPTCPIPYKISTYNKAISNLHQTFTRLKIENLISRIHPQHNDIQNKIKFL